MQAAVWLLVLCSAQRHVNRSPPLEARNAGCFVAQHGSVAETPECGRLQRSARPIPRRRHLGFRLKASQSSACNGLQRGFVHDYPLKRRASGAVGAIRGCRMGGGPTKEAANRRQIRQ